MKESHSWVWFYFWLAKIVVRDFFGQTQSIAMQNQNYQEITFDMLNQSNTGYDKLPLSHIFVSLECLRQEEFTLQVGVEN